MLLNLVRKSISRRKSRVVLAIVAVIMGAAIFTALVSTSLAVRESVGEDFREFGANILLIPESESIPISIGDIDYGTVSEQKFIEESDLNRIDNIGWAKNIWGVAPYLYSVVEVEGEKAVLAGVNYTALQRVNSWWSVDGEWANFSLPNEAMLGNSIADILEINVGDTVTVEYNNTVNSTMASFLITGLIETGESEDYQIFVNLGEAQTLLDMEGKVSTAQVSALCTGCPVEEIAAEIEAEIVYIEAKSVLQITNAEMEILGKVESLMFLITAVALGASVMGVMAMMTTTVVERRKEIGMMKALGAENRQISRLFLTEALLIGIIGGIIGFFGGVILAQFIGASTFDSSIPIQIIVLPLVLGVSIGVVLLASIIPVKRATGIEPARVLRGD